MANKSKPQTTGSVEVPPVETVTLPITPTGHVYVALPVEVKMSPDSDDRFLTVNAETWPSSTIVGCYINGVRQWLIDGGNSSRRAKGYKLPDGSILDHDESRFEAARRRWKVGHDGLYSWGKGGGGPLDTYKTVLRLYVSDELQLAKDKGGCGMKRSAADSLVRHGPEDAFLRSCESKAAFRDDTGLTGKVIFEAMWPKFTEKVRAEAVRRDSLDRTVDVDLDALAAQLAEGNEVDAA